MPDNLLKFDLATSADLAARDAREDILLLPVAAPENHGPHLPLATDALVGEDLARRAGEKLAVAFPHARVWLHPTWHLGAATIRGVGSVKVPSRVFRRALYGYLRRFVKQGLCRFVLLSAHGGVPHVGALDDVCAKLNRLRVGERQVRAVAPCASSAGKAFAGRYADQVRAAGVSLSEVEAADLYRDLHAGRMETSMILAIAPDQVREVYRSLPVIRPPERRWLNAIQGMLAKLVERCVKSESGRQRTLFALRIGAADLSWIIRGRSEGYLGDPAKASAAEGEALLAASAEDIADGARRVFTGEIDPKSLRSAAHLFRWFVAGCLSIVVLLGVAVALIL